VFNEPGRDAVLERFGDMGTPPTWRRPCRCV
jgi:hypothetical protein